MALGAGYDTNTIYKMGVEIARQCKRLGIHANYACVLMLIAMPPIR
jgi:beta-glucosidase-like glycosyl hydrolase